MQKYYVIKDCKGSIYLITGGDWGGNWDVIDAHGSVGCDYPCLLYGFPIHYLQEGFNTLDTALEYCFKESGAEVLGKISIKEFANTYMKDEEN